MGGDELISPSCVGEQRSVDCEFGDISQINGVLHLKSIRGHTESCRPDPD